MAKRRDEGQEEKRVGIWIRVSTEIQVQGDSPEHHEKRARLYAEAKGWQVVDVYRLEGVSGKAVMDHPEATRMLADVKRGRIDALIFSKLARLARSTKHLLEFADFFRAHNADLVSLGESIDTSTPAGRLFYTMISAMAEWEREEIAARVAASVPIRAKLGKPLGGQSPYGFVWRDGKFVQEPSEVPVRRLMYELFLEHRRKKTVARLLNEQGYRTRNGSKWSDTTIDRLLRDPTGKGIRIANYSKTAGPTGAVELKPESEWVYHDCERVVSDEVWNRVNAILNAQRDAGKRLARKAVHLFAGMAFCQCGGRLYVHSSNWNKYVCKECRTKIPIADLEGIFHEQLRAYALSPEEIEKHLASAHEVIRQKEDLIAILEAERTKIVREQDALIRLYGDGKLSKDDFGERYGPLADRRKEIDEELPALEASRDVSKINTLSTEEVMSAATDLYSRWPALSRDDQREIIEAIVDRITVGKEEISISFLVAEDAPVPVSWQQTSKDSWLPRAGSAPDRSHAPQHAPPSRGPFPAAVAALPKWRG